MIHHEIDFPPQTSTTIKVQPSPSVNSVLVLRERSTENRSLLNEIKIIWQCINSQSYEFGLYYNADES